MKINKIHTETVTHRRTKIELYQDVDGFWGWVIGKETLLATFKNRDSALRTAQRHIDNSK